MIRVLVWGSGNDFNQYINLLCYEELKGNCKIVGVTSRDEGYTKICGIPFVHRKELNGLQFDYIVICSILSFNAIAREIESEGIIDGDKILSIKVFLNHDFDIVKMDYVLRNRITIISNNCYAGAVYDRYAMRYNTPFIGMWESEADYLKLIDNLEYYLQQEPKLVEYGYNSVDQFTYPIIDLAGITIHANHYKSMEEFMDKWKRRIARVNYEHIKYIFCSYNDRNVKQFINKKPDGMALSQDKATVDESNVISLERFRNNIDNQYSFTLFFAFVFGRMQEIDFLTFLSNQEGNYNGRT